MEFRPCIDIHNGKVKQIVGSSLADEGDRAVENFVAGADAAYYAHLYKEAGLRGGHIILLNSRDSAYYEAACNIEEKCRKRTSGSGSKLCKAGGWLLYCDRSLAERYEGTCDNRTFGTPRQ